MFAQSMGEYGALGSIASSVESLAYSVRRWLEHISPATWVVVAIVAIGLYLWSRR
jgi:drug/metabolite transporter (DMT)-like permease